MAAVLPFLGVNGKMNAFGGTHPMLSVIESIYAAVGAPELWDITLRKIADLLGGESIALFAGAPNAQCFTCFRLPRWTPASGSSSSDTTP